MVTNTKTPKDWVSVTYLLVHLMLMVTGVLLALLPFKSAEPLGLSLLSAGIAGYIVFVYVLVSRDTSDRLDVLRRFGIKGAFASRATRIKDEYGVRLASASRRVDVLAFGLSALREDFGKDFGTWKLKAHVRILLIDPDFPHKDRSFADQRDLEEGRDAGTIRGHVRSFVRATGSLQDERFQIRLYKCLPSVNVFRIDDELLWGPYLVGEQGRNTPTFVAGTGIMFTSLINHFEKIWNDDGLSRVPPDAWVNEE